MEKFVGQGLLEFTERFPDDLSCYRYLSDIKWTNGYKCKKCGHTHFSEGKKYERTCTLCKHRESTTAGTLFHKVKFGIRKAFMICFELTASTKGLSSSQLSQRYGITRKTAWAFSHKIRLGMESKGDHPMEGLVHVDEFVIGGKENGKQGRSYHAKKKKVVCAVELDEGEQVKRVYAKRIDDFSSASLRGIFDKHISKKAKVVADQWKGYRPIAKDYNIEQLPSRDGRNFLQMHNIIHQTKTWVRTVFSWIHQKHTDKYLAEYSFRINRSIFKETIFHKLIERMVCRPHVSFKEIVNCS